MEDVHGVDVSWLHHHANKDAKLRSSSSKPSSKSSSKAPSQAPSQSNSRAPSPPPPSEAKPITERKIDAALQRDGLLTGPPPVTTQSTPPQKSGKRPGLLSKGSIDKLSTSPGSESKKRPAWISSLGSKFSSQNSQSNDHQLSPPEGAVSTRSRSASNLSPDAIDGSEEVEPPVPSQSKSSFFSSALRKLSSSGPSAGVKITPGPTACPRRVLNRDKGRPRCKVKELDQSKLRRVAFSVDVEVAGVSRYLDEADSTDPLKKSRDKQLQARSEGAALKNPKMFEAKKERDYGQGEEDPTARQSSIGSVDDIFEQEMLAAAREREKAAAHQRRQERRQKRAMEAALAAQNESGANRPDTPPSPAANKVVLDHKPQDKPTTDPLRMYRRCCQLREAPVLKRISEQLANMKTEAEQTGIVPCLDLNGSRMQLPDTVCLGDWLAIVPVKKLMLDNANLSDEGLRVILAGLLAAKPPGFSKRPSSRSSPTRLRDNTTRRSPGVIEKLSLRLNPKLTREGWKHVCLFLNMSNSIKGFDISMTPFPKTTMVPTIAPSARISGDRRSNDSQRPEVQVDMATLMAESISCRGSDCPLEELVLSDCGLSTHAVGKLVDAVLATNLSRLGLAKNKLDNAALQHVGRYIRSSNSKGLDIGGNDLRNGIKIVADAISPENTLFALSVADCNLDPESLGRLIVPLIPLKDFRFLDLSHNRDLFSKERTALGILRKYLPQMKSLRRIHLADVSMSSEHCTALAEILPEIRNINHVSFLENPELKRLATSVDNVSQEDACAVYASLMVAARVSKTLLAVDIEVPSPETNEIVQALAKQIVAYAVRNMERYTAVDAMNLLDPAAAISDTIEPGKDVPVPDVLAHLVGHPDHEITSESDAGPDQDFIVGGTGVVKALSYMLSQKSADIKRMSGVNSGSTTPTNTSHSQGGIVKAKDMSLDLLASARKIRQRLQLAIQNEQHVNDEIAQRRLQYLDHTLEGMIERFELEYPECAPSASRKSRPPDPYLNDLNKVAEQTGVEAVDMEPDLSPTSRSRASTLTDTDGSSLNVPTEDMEAMPGSRRASVTSLVARRQTQEEGQMHRLGQKFRREVMPPAGTDDHLHRTSRLDPAEPAHLAALRSHLEQIDADDLREQVVRDGLEATVRHWGEVGEKLKQETSNGEAETNAGSERELARRTLEGSTADVGHEGTFLDTDGAK